MSGTATAFSSINNKVEIIKEDSFGSGSGTDKTFGFIQKYSHNADTHTTQVYSLDGSPKPNANVDGITEFTGNLTWYLTDGRELESIFGSLTDGGGGTASLSIANTLPSYAIRSYEGDTNLLFKGVKVTKITLDLAKDEFVSITADLLGKVMVEDATAISVNTPTTLPFYFTDGYVSIGGTEYSGIDHISLEIDRHGTAYRGIEHSASNEKRLISSIVEGILSIGFNGSMTARKDVIEQVFGGASIVDVRDDVSITLNFSNGTNTLTLTISGARFTAQKKDEDTTADVVLVEFDGVGLDITASTTY